MSLIDKYINKYIDKYYEYKVRFDDWFYELKYIYKVRDIYWSIIPYNYRPHQIWYKIKCWGWHRYSTVKPRYLPHTWCDRGNLLPHIMFEILSDFIEGECSPGHVNWYFEGGYYKGHKIKVGSKLVWVRDEMQDLYDWWHKIYIPFNSEESERESRRLLNRIWEIESDMDKQLKHRLHRLINLMDYMWT